MKNPVTKIEFQNAQQHLTDIKPLLDFLNKTDPSTISDESAVQEKISEFKALIDDLLLQHKEVIARGERQYDERPADLINEAATRINLIPRLIEQEQKSMAHKLKSREFKVLELQKKHFNQVEIDQICPPISQDELDHSADKVQSLEHEKRVLLQFVGDSPEFNTEILRGTELYPEPVETA
jgi:hypothetical protein